MTCLPWQTEDSIHTLLAAWRVCAARRAVLLAAVAALFVGAATPAAAQVAWQYAPYNIEMWVGFAPAPEFTPRFEGETRRQIEALAEIEVGAPWTLTARPMPQPAPLNLLLHELEHSTLGLARLPSDTRAELVTWLPLAADFKLKVVPRTSEELRRALQNDKLMLAEVEPAVDGYHVRVQEFDCRTRTWGIAIDKTVWHIEELPYAIVSAAVEAFVPLARIDDVKNKEASLRLRAGGLLGDGPSPAKVANGALLRPYVRRNDRYGEARPGGIVPAPWTYLQVTSQAGAQLSCEISSGVRGAISSRSSPRNERLALVVAPRGETTRLVLQSKPTKQDRSRPLAGYEIYEPAEAPPAQPPPEGEKPAERSKLLGVTDWRGALEIGRGEKPLRVLIVKSGGQLLARLPMVPGLTLEERAEMPDDQKRLEAEGAMQGLNASLLDLVARREVLAARVRHKIKADDYPAAQALIKDLRDIDYNIDLFNRLDQYEREIRSPDAKVQARIDKLLSDTRALLYKHVNRRLPDVLAGELEKAKSGKS